MGTQAGRGRSSRFQVRMGVAFEQRRELPGLNVRRHAAVAGRDGTNRFEAQGHGWMHMEMLLEFLQGELEVSNSACCAKPASFSSMDTPFVSCASLIPRRRGTK